MSRCSCKPASHVKPEPHPPEWKAAALGDISHATAAAVWFDRSNCVSTASEWSSPSSRRRRRWRRQRPVSERRLWLSSNDHGRIPTCWHARLLWRYSRSAAFELQDLAGLHSEREHPSNAHNQVLSSTRLFFFFFFLFFYCCILSGYHRKYNRLYPLDLLRGHADLKGGWHSSLRADEPPTVSIPQPGFSCCFFRFYICLPRLISLCFSIVAACTTTSVFCIAMM